MSKFTAVLSLKMLENIPLEALPERILILAPDVLGTSGASEILAALRGRLSKVQRTLKVILDNGASEKTPVSGVDLIKAARIVSGEFDDCTYCLPDVLLDGFETYQILSKFVREHSNAIDGLKAEGVKTMIIPQGETDREYVQNIMQISKDPSVVKYVDIVGIPRNITGQAYKSRLEPSAIAYALFKKPIHLLGFAEPTSFADDIITATLDIVESIDSAVPLRCVTNNLKLPAHDVKAFDICSAMHCMDAVGPRGDWFEKTTSFNTELLMHNISVVTKVF